MLELPPTPTSGGYLNDSMDSDQFSLHDVRTPMEVSERPEGRKRDGIAQLAVLAGLGVLVLGTWLIVFLDNPSHLGLFAAHPPLQTLAIGFFTIGILTLQPTSTKQPTAKARGLQRHQLIMIALGFPTIFVGSVLIFYNKVIHESGHFTTWHATFGGIAFVWMIVQILLGGLSIWFGGAAFGGGAKAKAIWKYHRMSGYLLLPMFLITAAVGGNYSSWAVSASNIAVRIIVYTIAPVVILLGLWGRVRLSKMFGDNFRVGW